MAITFVQALQYSQQSGFRQQCFAAGLKAAFAVLDEVDTTASHTQRLAMAYAVISAPEEWSVRLATSCVGATASFPAATPTDATVESIITALWTKLALAFAASKAV
jgi:hypothetical protein